jgi:hypothetical protein
LELQRMRDAAVAGPEWVPVVQLDNPTDLTDSFDMAPINSGMWSVLMCGAPSTAANAAGVAPPTAAFVAQPTAAEAAAAGGACAEATPCDDVALTVPGCSVAQGSAMDGRTEPAAAT